jgi:predicted PurR-regulated permease PerM
VGGAAYVLNAFIAALVPNAGSWIGLFPAVGTVGEFWMIGLLLWKGLRPPKAGN